MSASSAFALGLLVLCLPSRPALAATPATSFGVSAVVEATCLVSASAVTFGTYADAIAHATSNVSVNCTNFTPYNISLSADPANGSAAWPAMAATDSALLRHALTTNTHGVVIRGWMLDTDAVAGSGNGSAQVLVTHRDVLAGEHVAASAGADAITVTIVY
jgi:spore coat protein U-like protein